MNKELREYVAEQVADYISSQTTGNYVSPQKMKILENGVQNICATAYPEHANILSKQVPRIIRATLDMNQLGLSGKMQRIIDSASKPKDEVISGMLNDIITAKAMPKDVAKTSWVGKLQSERPKQVVGNER
jgi:hypothetical protein